MSFKVNSSQQISFNDSVFSLTAREKKALDNSWAKIFADEIFPNIDEERFSVLYSSKASRPNAPVNVIIGALIIKELFDYSDDEIVENLMLDLHLQYALHTTSFEEQPISDKTLSRFRSRCYNYETTHGIDLYHDCVKDLSSKIAKLMNLSGRIKRMDSMMIESNIRFLSRMELIYTCISKLAIYFDKNYPNKIPDDLKHYTDSNDYNRIFYHQLNDNMEQIIQALLSDSDKLLELCGTDYEEVTEYQLFLRCLSDQTVVENGKRRLRTNDDGTILLRCAAGHEPVRQSYTKTTRQCKVSFNCNHCVGCPYQGQCRPKIDGWNATFITSKNASNRAKSQRYMQSEEFSNYAKLRNGVETVPANIRKNYRLDKLPRGKQRGKFFFGSKIAALNFRKLFGFRKGLVNYAQNPIFG